jgi:hypothetical protein
MFYLYLPLLLRGDGTRALVAHSEWQLALWQTAWFDSGILAPGARFTHTFALTGTFTYYSRYHPGDVVGTIVIVEVGETATESVDAGTGISIATSSGAGLKIAAAALLTDTVATIRMLPEVPITNTAGTVVGAMYDLDVAEFEDVVSGTVTLTLPYDPAALPDGADESQVRAAYYNGRAWIDVPGTVDPVRDMVVVTTTHLSLWTDIFGCTHPFDLTHEEENAYKAALAYIGALADHQDLFEVLRAGGDTDL